MLRYKNPPFSVLEIFAQEFCSPLTAMWYQQRQCRQTFLPFPEVRDNTVARVIPFSLQDSNHYVVRINKLYHKFEKKIPIHFSEH